MRLHEDDRERLQRKLGADNGDDVVLAVNIIEALANALRDAAAGKAPRALAYELDVTSHSDRFAVHFTGGIDVFTHDCARTITRQSQRVLDVRIDFGAKRVSVHVARAAAHERTPIDAVRYVPPSASKKRRVATDYEAARVTNADDRQTIDALVHDVYHVEARVPADMDFWFEVVKSSGGGAHLSKHFGGAELPLTDDASMAGGSIDESLSERDAGGITVGYSLCFVNVPSLSCAFLEHLVTKHSASIIANAYAWFNVPASIDKRALFVVNVRSASVPASDAKRVVTNNLPRGVVLVAPRGRARKHA